MQLPVCSKEYKLKRKDLRFFYYSEESSSKEVKDASSSLLDCADDPRFANSRVSYKGFFLHKELAHSNFYLHKPPLPR